MLFQKKKGVTVSIFQSEFENSDKTPNHFLIGLFECQRENMLQNLDLLERVTRSLKGAVARIKKLVLELRLNCSARLQFRQDMSPR